MNTTMADGAEQRLDAQIAEALFGQPGMSKMDVANRVRELRGDGPALLVPREAGQDERARFKAWWDAARPLDGSSFPYEIASAAWQAALAARQPVGEPVVVAHRYIQHYQSAEHSTWLNGDADETYVEAERQGLGQIERAYAAPPAQADQEYLESLDRALEGVIDQRDRYHETADDLAGHIASITGVDIGEHSSANCPWQNAIHAAEEYQPAQAVDLERFRPAVMTSLGLSSPNSTERETLRELLALIDGKAVQS